MTTNVWSHEHKFLSYADWRAHVASCEKCQRIEKISASRFVEDLVRKLDTTAKHPRVRTSEDKL